MKTNINVDEVLNTMDQAFTELKSGIKVDQLTLQEKNEIASDLDEVIKLALTMKLQNQKRQLDAIIETIEKGKLSPILIEETTTDLEGIAVNINQLKQKIKTAT